MTKDARTRNYNLNKNIAVEDTKRAYNRISRERDEVGELERGLVGCLAKMKLIRLWT